MDRKLFVVEDWRTIKERFKYNETVAQLNRLFSEIKDNFGCDYCADPKDETYGPWCCGGWDDTCLRCWKRLKSDRLFEKTDSVLTFMRDNYDGENPFTNLLF